EHRHDNDRAGLSGKLSNSISRGPRYLLGELKQRRVLLLAEVLRAEQLGEADDPGALARGLLEQRDRPLDIFSRLRACGHLNQPDFKTPWTLHRVSLHKLPHRLQAPRVRFQGSDHSIHEDTARMRLDTGRPLVIGNWHAAGLPEIARQ